MPDLQLDLPQCQKLLAAEDARTGVRIIGALSAAAILMHQLDAERDADTLLTIRQILDNANDTFVSGVGADL